MTNEVKQAYLTALEHIIAANNALADVGERCTQLELAETELTNTLRAAIEPRGRIVPA